MDTSVNLSELVAKAQNGDIESFGRIYDLLLDRIYRFMYFRVNNEEDAEDLTETVFMKIWEGLKGYKDTGVPFEAWVFRIARNSVTDYYRTRKANISTDEVSEVEDQSDSVEDIVGANLTKEKVLEALKRLLDTYKEIITMKFIEELENEEISQILDKPVDQIRVLQSRAIKALRKVLNESI